jgi:hypothetical protein
MARLHFSQFNPEGTLEVSGSLNVVGQSTFTQNDTGSAAVIMSGSMAAVQADTTTGIVSASIAIQNLGSLGDRSIDAELDLSEGDDF